MGDQFTMDLKKTTTRACCKRAKCKTSCTRVQCVGAFSISNKRYEMCVLVILIRVLPLHRATTYVRQIRKTFKRKIAIKDSGAARARCRKTRKKKAPTNVHAPIRTYSFKVEQ